MKKHWLRVGITWGGSGGHILPLVSLLQTLDTQSQYWTAVDSVYRFGETKGMEKDFYDQYCDSFDHIQPKFVSIISGKYRRETIRISRWRNVRDICFRFPRGIVQSLRYILTKKIDVMFAKGWYVSLPVVIAAWIARRPIYVHESDTKPWLTTRLASKFAKQSFTWFPNVLPQAKVTWQILSDRLLEDPLDPPVVLDPERITILVSGGSLGSKKLYQAVLKALQSTDWFAKYAQIVFIHGQHLIDPSDLPSSQEHIHITGLIKDQASMGWLYRHADRVIMRAGTTSLAEAKIFDLPLVMVPLPITHDQYSNARYYVETYQDLLIDQEDPEFVSLLGKALAKTSKRAILTLDTKTKQTIFKPKQIILDALIGL